MTTTAPTTRAPILAVGTFGLHILSNPKGTFSFFGTIPGQLVGKTSATEAEAVAKFIAWFKSMPTDEQREHVGNLRADIFAALFNS